MKKMYLKPETNTFYIELRPIMDFSFDDPNNTGTGTLSEESVDGDAWSRQSDWDE